VDLWQSRKPPEENEVAISVIAELGDGTCSVWTRCYAHPGSLQQLASDWSQEHGVPIDAVGYESEPPEGHDRGARVDVKLSPLELGWSGRRHACIYALPLQSAFVADEGSALESSARGKKSAAAPARAAAEGRPAKAARKAGGGGSAGGGGAAVAAAAAVGGAGKQLERYKNHDGSDPPGLDEAIEYFQDNPKKEGSAGWQRYENYKLAKTPQEALDLGSAKGDLVHDWRKGYYKKAS